MTDRAKAEAKAKKFCESTENIAVESGYEFLARLTDLILSVQDEAADAAVLVYNQAITRRHIAQEVAERNAEVKRVVEEVRADLPALPELACDEILRRLGL